MVQCGRGSVPSFLGALLAELFDQRSDEAVLGRARPESAFSIGRLH